MSVHLRSEGCLDPNKTAGCGLAFIEVNGQEYCGKRRGVNVVVFSAEGKLDHRTAQITSDFTKSSCPHHYRITVLSAISSNS